YSANAAVTWTCFAVAMAAVGACEGTFWTMAVELGGARGGFAAGILNTGGNAGGAVAPKLTPVLSKMFGWQAGFALAIVPCVIGALCWIGIDPHEDDQAP